MSEIAEEVKSEAILVDINAIDADWRPGKQMRAQLDQEQFDRYRREIDQCPEVELMYDVSCNTYWVIDGHYRLSAAYAEGRREAEAVVRFGSYEDALRLACRANKTHGVPLTDADKRHRVKEVLKLPLVKDWKQQQIADLCDVSIGLVSQLDNRAVFHREKPPSKPAPAQESGGNGEPESESESNGQATSTRGKPKDPTRPKGGRPRQPKPAEPTAEEKAAESWRRAFDKHAYLMASFRKAGGIRELTRSWDDDRKQLMRELLDDWMGIIAGLKTELEEEMHAVSRDA